jgi:hypothetical protein
MNLHRDLMHLVGHIGPPAMKSIRQPVFFPVVKHRRRRQKGSCLEQFLVFRYSWIVEPGPWLCTAIDIDPVKL